MSVDKEIKAFLLKETDREERARLRDHIKDLPRSWIREMLFRLNPLGRWLLQTGWDSDSQSVHFSGDTLILNLNHDPGADSHIRNLRLTVVERDGEMMLQLMASGLLHVLPSADNVVHIRVKTRF